MGGQQAPANPLSPLRQEVVGITCDDVTMPNDDLMGVSKNKLVSPALGEHPLQYNYTFWYSRRTPSRPASTHNYEQNIRQFGTVASV
ncbi:hypothetical protein FKM82_028710, partial [Ascaphus truei]